MGALKRLYDPVGDLIFGSRGDSGGGDVGAAQREAEAKQAELEKQRAAQQAQLDSINQNAAKDLSQENRAQIVAGGTADIVTQAQDDARRKRVVGGLSTALGINV
ncbi:virion structural protein [Ralstonia phage phiAp1]|uniref:Structural protein n=1 Tax=Ralstonia phage phiAp1 TaxID=2783867 RepID=A0A1L7DS58_9CAUD|nr:virion structural protein [Ralstonia phage phiAp1]APU03178.1 structural protein [Ralstonia phage phiAp1]